MSNDAATAPRMRRVQWEETDSTEWPMRSVVASQRWAIRLGDFPAEPLYTLFIDDVEVESFDEWPPRWVDPKRAKVSSTGEAGATSVSADAKKLHAGWLARGRSGSGRLVCLSRDLGGSKASGSVIPFSRFERSTLDGADLTYADLTDAELIGCSAVRIRLASAQLDRALIERVHMPDADLRLALLEDAQVGASDLTGARTDRARLVGAEFEEVVLRGAKIFDATLDRARFVDCDFRDADLSRVDDLLDLCTSTGTRFERCDFRGSNWHGRKLSGTVFDHCRFHGVHGRAVVEAPCAIVAPDFSSAGDGSDVRDAAAVEAPWK